MKTVREARIEREAKLYGELTVQVNRLIRAVRRMRDNARMRSCDITNSQETSSVWRGMETAYSNVLVDLELADMRAHREVSAESTREALKKIGKEADRDMA